MARKEHTPVGPAFDIDNTPAGHALALSEEQQTHDLESEMAFTAARIVGRIETALFSETVSQKVIVESFLELKKNKAYRAISFRDADGNLKRVQDLEEFCERYLKRTYRRVKQMADNYHLIGADLYESAEQIGFRQKDYSALKTLPSDDQDVIRQAMQTEDSGQVIDLIQEMAVRHASEKAALTAQTKEAEDTAAARDDVIKAKESKISQLEVRAASAERRQADFTDIEKRDYECAPLHKALSTAMLELDKIAREVAHLTQVVGGQLMRDECLHALAMVAQRAVNISETYHLPIDKDVLLSDYSELDLRAAGLKPEALQ
jgi:hypothetical protein